ncbi:hypothetical protein [Microvirga makkahensis]|nr:hypothetical protein [Microvirga makkahensis]
MWVPILTAIVTCGLRFLVFAVSRAVHPAPGGIDTLVPITSGRLAALAVEARIVGLCRAAHLQLGGAVAPGLGFIVILAAVDFPDSVANLKNGTAFWQMVDPVWVVMYRHVCLIG